MLTNIVCSRDEAMRRQLPHRDSWLSVSWRLLPDELARRTVDVALIDARDIDPSALGSDRTLLAISAACQTIVVVAGDSAVTSWVLLNLVGYDIPVTLALPFEVAAVVAEMRGHRVSRDGGRAPRLIAEHVASRVPLCARPRAATVIAAAAGMSLTTLKDRIRHLRWPALGRASRLLHGLHVVYLHERGHSLAVIARSTAAGGIRPDGGAATRSSDCAAAAPALGAAKAVGPECAAGAR